MTQSDRTRREFTVLAGGGLLALAATPALAAKADKIASKSRTALNQLYSLKPKAREYGSKARAILVFPEILKAGAVIGGQRGEGALFKRNKVVGFYSITAASYGLQLGAQKFAYALFFMDEKALDYLNKSDGWSVGTGPSIVFVDEGYAKSVNTTTLKDDVYAMAFGQKGLMAGTGLEGSKITQIYPDA